MPLLIPFFIFLIFCLNLSDGKISEEKFQVVIDYLNSFDLKSNRLVGYFCDSSDLNFFAKTMFKNNMFVSIFYNSVQIPEFVPLQRVVHVVDFNCQKLLKNLLSDDLSNKFQSPHKWIILNNSSEDNSFVANIKMLFSNLPILIDSNFNLITYSKNNSKISRIYKLLPKSKFLSENFKGNKNTCKRQNLEKIVIKACIVITNNDSLNHLTDRRDAHVDTIAKVNYVLVNHLGDILNATLNFSISNTWGYKDNNSRWSGMIGELTRHETDIGATPSFLTSDRVKIVEYVAMTTPTGSKFVFLQPKLSFVTNIFFLPFQIYVWVSIICLLLICGFVLYGVVFWEKNYLGFSVLNSGQEIFFLEFTAFCQQGVSFIPKSLTGRSITIMLLIVLMFLYNSYSANIVALLQSSSNNIQTLKDLLHSRLSVGVDDNVYNRFYFPNETEPIRRELYLKKVVPTGKAPNFFQMMDGVRKIREGLFAFHMETGAGYRLVAQIFHEHEKCGLQEIEFFKTRNPWLTVQKNSSFKEIIKIGLKKLEEYGIQKREVSLLYTEKPPCISRGSGFISVGLIDTYFAFSILISGIILSFILLFMEITVVRYYKNRSF